jgi:hypothetical protein
MKKQLVISISALALIGALASPVLAANVGATVGATVSGQANTPAGDANANASSNSSTQLTTNEVTRDRPFGDITVDQSRQPNDADFAAMTDAQKQELNTRCDVIGQNAQMYNNDTSLWCKTYLDWYKKGHPAG